MNIIGIVCEYNPFHNGHGYQIEESRKLLGEDSLVVCVMSGDFVQRGEPAIFSKFSRAEAACRCGADIVIELPLPWALASAEKFALGSVYILNCMGCTHLSFGSEAGELCKLEDLALKLIDSTTITKIKQLLSDEPELSFAAARQKLLGNELGDCAKLLEQPNNILAVEYLKAIKTLSADIKPITIKRQGSGHDKTGNGSMRSASELRNMLRCGTDISGFVPEQALKVYRRELEHGRAALDADRTELAILSRLRMLEENIFLRLPDAGDGAGQRLCKASKTSASLEELYQKAKTKRLAMARIRRMCMCAALGIDRDMTMEEPLYARLLAANEKGRSYLSQIKGETTIPVLTKPASVKYIGDRALQMFVNGANAHDLFCLLYSETYARIPGQDWRTGPKIV